MELFEFLTATTPGKCLFTMLVSMLPVKNKNRKFVFAQRNSGFDYTQRIRQLTRENPDMEIYLSCGRWYYWVTLPVDKVWTFEIDDVKPVVVSPLTGLMLLLLLQHRLQGQPYAFQIPHLWCL